MGSNFAFKPNMSMRQPGSKASRFDSMDSAQAQDVSIDQRSFAIDPARNRFPFCVVWGPLPVISWILPFIGHMGICDSKGRVHDFAGPYHIGVDRFMVGSVTKYLPINPSTMQPDTDSLQTVSDGASSGCLTASSTAAGVSADSVQSWDQAVSTADKEYSQQMHNICCNNCHHHSASALCEAGLPMTMFEAWKLITFRGRWVSGGAWLSTNLPFLILLGFVLFFSLFKFK